MDIRGAGDAKYASVVLYFCCVMRKCATWSGCPVWTPRPGIVDREIRSASKEHHGIVGLLVPVGWNFSSGRQVSGGGGSRAARFTGCLCLSTGYDYQEKLTQRYIHTIQYTHAA